MSYFVKSIGLMSGIDKDKINIKKSMEMSLETVLCQIGCFCKSAIFLEDIVTSKYSWGTKGMKSQKCY